MGHSRSSNLSGKDHNLTAGCVVFHAAVGLDDVVKLKHSPNLGFNAARFHVLNNRLEGCVDKGSGSTR